MALLSSGSDSLHVDRTPRPDRDTVEAVIAECGFENEPTYRLHCRDTYFDTFDGRLLKAGLRLSWRAGEHRWTLAEDGRELADQIGPGEELPPGPIREKLARTLKKRSLIAFLDVDREERILRQAQPGAEISVRWREFSFIDPQENRSTAGPRILSWEGVPNEELRMLVNHLRTQPTRNYDPFLEGLRELGIPVPGASPPPAFRIQSTDTLVAGLQKILSTQAFILTTRHRGARLDLDPEYIHQMRVATRRGRAALRLLGREIESPRPAAIAAELKWLGNGLGLVRDMDVLTSQLPGFLNRIHTAPAERKTIEDAFLARRRGARNYAVQALDSSRYRNLIAAMLSFHADLESQGTLLDTPMGQAGPRVLARSLRRVLKWGKKSARKLSIEDLHRIRIAFKRLRYTGEFVAAFHSEDLQTAIKRAAAFQDCLGDANDAAVARGYFQGLAEVWCADGRPRPEPLLALGALIHIQHEKAERQRRRFEKLWKQFPEEAAQLRQWLP